METPSTPVIAARIDLVRNIALIQLHSQICQVASFIQVATTATTW
jgi:hypothetical protein